MRPGSGAVVSLGAAFGVADLGRQHVGIAAGPVAGQLRRLLLLAPVARACLRAEAVPWALLLFACSEKVIGLTVDAKQYLVDTFVMVLVPAVWCSTKTWPIGRRTLMFAAVAPVVIFLAFPGCFVMGGLLLAMLLEVWTQRRQIGAWLGYGLIVLTTFTAFGLLVVGPVRASTRPLSRTCGSTPTRTGAYRGRCRGGACGPTLACSIIPFGPWGARYFRSPSSVA